MASVPSKYLDRRDSYYGQELPEHLQDDLTKDILLSTRINPDEALRIANEEQKQIQEEKARRKRSEGAFMYQINNLERGRKLLDQSEKTAKFYDRYKQRLTKRQPPSSVNEMISKVSASRNNRGGRRTRKRVRKNKTKRRRNKNNKKRV